MPPDAPPYTASYDYFADDDGDPATTRIAIQLPEIDLPPGEAREDLLAELRDHLEYELKRLFGGRFPNGLELQVNVPAPVLRVDAVCPRCPQSPALRPTLITPSANGRTSGVLFQQPAPATTLRIQVECPDCGYSGTGIYRLQSLRVGNTPKQAAPLPEPDSAETPQSV